MSISRLLLPPRGEDFGIGQAVIREWDLATFENVIEYDGLLLRDLPVASGVEALTYQPGDVVLLEQWFPGGAVGERGLGTYWIKARLIQPGTDAADQAIAFMATQLGRAVLGGVIQGDRTNGVVIVTASSWGDPSTGDAGPTLADVAVSEAGRCIVHMNAHLSQLTLSDGSVGEVQMSFAVSGATTRASGTSGTLSLGRGQSGTGGNDIPSGGIGATVLLEGLNEGDHTIHAEYQLTGSVTSATVTFPTLVAIPY